MATKGQQAAAKKVATKRRVKKAAAAVKEARERANDLEVTDLGEWKKDATDRVGETKLALPSGKVCLVKMVGLEPFFRQGMIPNNLLPIVSDAIQQGKGLSKKETDALITDPTMIASMLDLSDSVVCDVVIQPPVSPASVRDEIMADERLNDDEKKAKCAALLFVDEVDLQDKFFIFQFVVGGTRDLESFRQQQEVAVADLAAEPAVPAETE